MTSPGKAPVLQETGKPSREDGVCQRTYTIFYEGYKQNRSFCGQ